MVNANLNIHIGSWDYYIRISNYTLKSLTVPLHVFPNVLLQLPYFYDCLIEFATWVFDTSALENVIWDDSETLIHINCCAWWKQSSRRQQSAVLNGRLNHRTKPFSFNFQLFSSVTKFNTDIWHKENIQPQNSREVCCSACWRDWIIAGFALVFVRIHGKGKLLSKAN